jgi:PAS domain S-box-containing protein
MLGLTLVLFSYQKITQSYDRRALDTVRALAAALDTEEVRSLSARESDQDKPAYLAMKNRLIRTFSATSDANAAYFFTLRDGLVYFMVDSEPLGTTESSPAGQHYSEAPPEAYSIFSSDQPLMTKAYSDRWGSWISAYILLPQGETDLPIAFGLDYNASSFYFHAKLRALGVSFIILVLFVLFLVASLILKNNSLLEVEKKKAQEASMLLKNLQHADRQQRILVETTLQSLGEAVISTDIEGTVVIMNRMAQQLTGWDGSEAIGKPLKDVFHVVDGLTLKPFEKSWPHTVLKTGIPIPYDNKEVRLIRKDGSLVAIEDMVSPIFDEEGTITGVVLIFVDGTEKRLQKDELLYLSTHDGLTGLLNRQAFYQNMQDMDVPKHFPLVLMLLDINGLKLINEAYGHATGDSLLNEIAIILQRPGHRGQVVGRVDGDEFAIFFPNVSLQVTGPVWGFFFTLKGLGLCFLYSLTFLG